MLKYSIPPENCEILGDAETRIEPFVARNTHQHFHESLGNLTSVDLCFDAASQVIT